MPEVKCELTFRQIDMLCEVLNLGEDSLRENVGTEKVFSKSDLNLARRALDKLRAGLDKAASS